MATIHFSEAGCTKYLGSRTLSNYTVRITLDNITRIISNDNISFIHLLEAITLDYAHPLVVRFSTTWLKSESQKSGLFSPCYITSHIDRTPRDLTFATTTMSANQNSSFQADDEHRCLGHSNYLLCSKLAHSNWRYVEDTYDPGRLQSEHHADSVANTIKQPL